MKKLNWRDIGTSIGAILVLVQTVYPAATGEAIVSALLDGTWLPKAINVAFAYILIRHKGEQVQP